MDAANVNKCMIQLRTESRNLKIQVKNLTTENKKVFYYFMNSRY